MPPVLSDFFSQAINLFFLGLSVLLALVILGAIVAFSIWTQIRDGRKDLRESDKMIDEAPFIWIIPNYVGWIYVNPNTQVGLIGRDVFKTSWFFFDLLNNKTRKIFSTKAKDHEIPIENISTSDHFKFDSAKIFVSYRVKKSEVCYLYEKAKEPDEFLMAELKTKFINFFQNERAEMFSGNTNNAQEKLEYYYEMHLNYYSVSVKSLVCQGAYTQHLNEIASISMINKIKENEIENTIKLALRKRDINMQEKMFDQLVNVMLTKILAEDIASGKDSTLDIQRIADFVDAFLNDANNPSINIKSHRIDRNLDLNDNATSEFERKIEKALSRSSFKLVKDGEGAYEIEYLGYTVTLTPDNAQKSIQYSVYDQQKKLLGSQISQISQISQVSIEQLLTKLQKGIEGSGNKPR